jgi:hypothetical protein
MTLARVVTVLAMVGFAACSSPSAQIDGGDKQHDASGSADHPTGSAGASAAGASGTAGAAGTSTAGAAGTSAAGSAGTSAAGAAGANPDAAAGAGGAAGASIDARDAGKQTVIEFPAPGNRDVDLLFMVDDSFSMAPLQQKLIAGFPTFVDALKGFPGGLPNLHIAVVSSSMGAGRNQDIPHCPPGGDQGIFQSKPVGTTCAQASLNAGQNFIISGPGGQNFTGDVSDMFSCIAALGDGGCGLEHQFESVLRALGADGAAAPAQNAGFLRAGAFLDVVMLTNEDDCSAPPDSDLFDDAGADPITFKYGPLQSYRCNEFGHLCGGQPPPRTPANPPVDLSGTCVSSEDGHLIRVADIVAGLKAVKANPSMIVVSAITGPANPYIVNVGPSQIAGDTSMWPFIEHSCMAADGTYADPSVRIQQAVNAFGSNGLLLSICDADLGNPMRVAASQLENVMAGWPCLPANVDAAACAFVDHVRADGGAPRDVALPACGTTGATLPCWTSSASASCASGRLVQFMRTSGADLVGTTASCPPGD